MSTNNTTRRTEPTTRGLQLQESVLSSWRAANGPEHLRANRQRGHAAAGVWGKSKARAYAGAAMGRTTADWVGLSTSADAEIYGSLRGLRNRSRQLCRDNEHAKNGLRLVVNNVVGQGIGFQSEILKRRGKGQLNEPVNDAIEKAWRRWGRARRCHTAGKLGWAQIQRVVMAGAVESGEILVRKVRRKFADSRVPFALELIEADQLVDTWTGRAPNGNQVRMGIEVDEWLRPVAYWLYPRHPGDNIATGIPQTNEYQRVPADEIIHIGLFERPNQTRCVPWFHAAMVKLRHIGGTEEAEIVRARASAAVMGFVQHEDADLPEPDDSADGEENGERVWDMAPGTIRELPPGTTFSGFNPSSANAALDPFLRYMLRSVAAGIGLSYESLSRDYSQSNYSSSRLALLDDRDNWRVLQAWLIEVFHQEVFEAWLEMAVLCGELDLPGYETDPEIYQAVRWMPRGWDWVDPQREVNAAIAAVRAGFTTVADVVAAKGGDWEDVFKQAQRERQNAKDLGLEYETFASKAAGQQGVPVQTSGQGEQPKPGKDDEDAEPGEPGSGNDEESAESALEEAA